MRAAGAILLALLAWSRPIEAQARGPHLTVKDRVDDAPVAGLAFLVDDREIETDAEGRLPMSREPAAAPRPVGPDWHVAGFEEDVLYVYRDLRIEGQVARVGGSRPLIMSAVQVSYWHDEGPARELPAPDAAGGFDATVPRLPGLTFRIRAPGWHGDRVTVRVDRDSVRAVVVLPLRTGLRIGGTLRDDTGRPLGRVRVVAYVTIRGTPGNLTSKDARRIAGEGRGYTYCTSVQTNEAALNVNYQAFTNAGGRWSLELDHLGDLLLVAHVRGHRPAWNRAGRLAGTRHDLALVAERARHVRRVPLFLDGRPIADDSVTLADLSARFGDPQPAVGVETDSEGCIPDSWLERGHRYAIIAKHRHVLKFEWLEQAELDIPTPDR